MKMVQATEDAVRELHSAEVCGALKQHWEEFLNTADFQKRQDLFIEHLFDDCSRQFRGNNHKGLNLDDSSRSGCGSYTHAIITMSNDVIPVLLTADFFLTLNPQLTIVVLGLRPLPKYGDRNVNSFKALSSCLRERFTLSPSQLTLDASPVEEAPDQLHHRVGQLCEQCWRTCDADIVLNFTAGLRQQTQAIVQAASVYGCDLVYTDLAKNSWVKAIRAPHPRRQFLRGLPNLMGDTFGVVGLNFAHQMFADKSFYLARFGPHR